MIILGSVNSNKRELLIKEYIRLINSGLSPQSILFLTLNAYKKNLIKNQIKAFLPDIYPNVQTFLGLCYNSILENWDTIQKNITIGENKPQPLLCGLEVSQNILLDIVKKIGFKDYNSKINLVHQLLRRHALIVGNNLSQKEVDEKSIILNESFAEEAKQALELFKAKTLELRAFDYLRQQSLFNYLYSSTTTFNYIKYIFIDDYDEQTPACTDFFKTLKPTLQGYALCLDKEGSTRCGYLCADKNCISILSDEKNIIHAQTKQNHPTFSLKNYSKRLELLQAVSQQILSLIKTGTSPNEISIITPLFDNQLKFTLQNEFENFQIPTQFISGSQKLIENSLIKSILSLLKLINNLHPTTDDINNIMQTLLKIPSSHSCEIIKYFDEKKGFKKHEFFNKVFNENYNKFLNLANEIPAKDPLYIQLEKIYNKFIAGESFTDEEIADFEFLKKQIHDLEAITINNEKLRIIKQIENSIISENDSDSFKLDNKSIIISTPQKIVDFEIKTKIQFWLDATNDEWIKQDTGTIYNAWVFAKNWHKKTYTYDDSINCIKDKTSRLLKKLKSLAYEKIFVLSSSYNSLGQENLTGISTFFKNPSHETNKNSLKDNYQTFTPRCDQKPILNYKQGKMAIAAVPGAGKTTVLQALVSKLLTDGVQAENIFVLTYMESAAKNIRERITSAYPDLNTYPNISTIHGLALRIIKENGNYSYLNLNENFDICDDLQRQKLIRETIGELGLKYDEYEKFEKGISIAKFSDIDKTPNTKELKEFTSFYQAYKTKLAQNNLIDYDDMLLMAVKLLEEHPQILSHYQKLCKFIIEDEAQDSSAIQQKLITLLAGENGNIVRCGDLNQAITSTFTNADTKGFKLFIQNNKSIEMNYSQRCCKDIFELANKLIDISENSKETKNAFYKIKMQEVENKNPKSKKPILAKIFETENDEKTAIIQHIKNIFSTTPNASTAILLRNNFQVNEYSALLKENGISTISRTDCLEQNTVFNIILSLLKFCTMPWNNFLTQEVYQKIFNIKDENSFLTNLEIPFISIDPAQLDDENLISLHWELNYWLSLSTKPFEFLALKIGEYYSKNNIDNSNLFIIAEIIRRLSETTQNRADLLTKLEQISKRPTIAGLKLFSESDTTISTLLGGKVQIMTMHKAKGDEFDYVFVPELTEKALGSSIKSIKTGNFISFYEEIKALNSNYTRKNALQIKQEILEENLRLLYVVITRAKKQIFFSAAKNYKKFGKTRPTEVSTQFKSLLFDYTS